MARESFNRRNVGLLVLLAGLAAFAVWRFVIPPAPTAEQTAAEQRANELRDGYDESEEIDRYEPRDGDDEDVEPRSNGPQSVDG